MLYNDKDNNKKDNSYCDKIYLFYCIPNIENCNNYNIGNTFSGRYVLCLLFKVFDHGEKWSMSLQRQTLESNPLEVNLGEVLGHTMYCSLHCPVINRC